MKLIGKVFLTILIQKTHITYQTTMSSILDEITPVKEYTINPNKVLKEQWMTPGLMKCTMKQRSLYEKH